MTPDQIDQMSDVWSVGAITREIVTRGALHIRRVVVGDTTTAYHYSAGGFGPGYSSIKGTVGDQRLFRFLVRQEALRLIDVQDFNFIAGLVTGGVTPAYQLRQYLQNLQGREIGYVYIRDSRKAGGTMETVTGLFNTAQDLPNPYIPLGSVGVVEEELVNYANSIANGARVLRDGGYPVAKGFTILSYDHKICRQHVSEAELELTALVTMPQVLDSAEELGLFAPELVSDYRDYLNDPDAWMAKYNFEVTPHDRPEKTQQ